MIFASDSCCFKGKAVPIVCEFSHKVAEDNLMDKTKEMSVEDNFSMAEEIPTKSFLQTILLLDCHKLTKGEILDKLAVVVSSN